MRLIDHWLRCSDLDERIQRGVDPEEFRPATLRSEVDQLGGLVSVNEIAHSQPPVLDS